MFSPVLFNATFKVDQSAVKALQAKYDESGFAPANCPKLTDPTHPFQSIYVKGVEKTMATFDELMFRIPEDFELTFTPSPPMTIPGKSEDFGSGLDIFRWKHEMTIPNNVKTPKVTDGALRRWTPLGEQLRPESQGATVELNNKAIWFNALDEFKKWLPLGMTSIALQAQSALRDRMKQLVNQQQMQLDMVSDLISGFAKQSAMLSPYHNIPDRTAELMAEARSGSNS